ncbi:MAG TPA: hypothetical protein O0X25_01720 [Methanocorpusculum sp.]|nr:hypothetical protein [Methanocorpusculum sp.]HJJ39715.1 hypothetical protein [Methanocorpusculum sp.]HJJ49324.1 hypothetical protein [Methanocorpusculum sp.]HJJ56632.1 hypothetical protein [Methanocorpusculum sp.]
MPLADFAHSGTGNAEVLEVRDSSAEAKEIYREGTALNYMCGCVAKLHADDKPVIRALFLSYASVFVKNCNGINIEITGSAGSGKTHIINSVLKCIPEKSQLNGKLSDKALFYLGSDLSEGTVLHFDDQDLSPDLQGTIKNLSWDKPTIHHTVKQQSMLKLEIPPRCPYWNTKAEGAGDEQIQDRLLKFWADESEEHKRRRDKMQAKYLMDPGLKDSFDEYLSVCREIWYLIKQIGIKNVVIPYADRITGGDGDARTQNMFTALIQASTILHASIRKKSPEGFLIATEEDFLEAACIINPLMKDEGGSQINKLNANAKRVLEALKDKPSGIYSYEEIMMMVGKMRKKGMAHSEMTYAIDGRNDEKTDGLVAKCPAITVIGMSSRGYDNQTDTTLAISRKGVSWNKELYESWNAGDKGFSLDNRDPTELMLELNQRYPQERCE